MQTLRRVSMYVWKEEGNWIQKYITFIPTHLSIRIKRTEYFGKEDRTVTYLFRDEPEGTGGEIGIL